jgi:hypothetical protein
VKKYNLNISFFILVTSLLFGFVSYKNYKRFYKIPEQDLDLNKLIGDTLNKGVSCVNSFEISSLVTFKEYKEYLKEIKKDSTEEFYYKQLPDSSIAPLSVWNEYTTSNEYDKYPVLGIRWESAMNYCKWKTLNENANDSLCVLYTLPYFSEWLAAKYYLDLKNVKHDFSKNYSDWLIVAFDESVYNFLIKNFTYDYIYNHQELDPRALKRKRIIGNSYLFNGLEQMHYGYADRGYRYVGFRYVKRIISTEEKQDFMDFYFGQYKRKKKNEN